MDANLREWEEMERCLVGGEANEVLCSGGSRSSVVCLPNSRGDCDSREWGRGGHHLGDAGSGLGITLMIFPFFMMWIGVLVLAATALARAAARIMAWSAC